MCECLERMKEAIKFLGAEVRGGGKLASEGADEGFGSSGRAQALEAPEPPLQSQCACFAKGKQITASEGKPEHPFCMFS